MSDNQFRIAAAVAIASFIIGIWCGAKVWP